MAKKLRQEIPEGEFLKNVGARIRALRKAKGWSNHETFAYEFDLNRGLHGRHERGADMRLSSLLKILNGLGVSPVEFFSEGFEEV